MSNPNHDPKTGEFASGSGGNSTHPSVERAVKTMGRHGYNPEAVQKQIISSSRHGPKIGGKEASAIHRLLRGR